jgi:hypothetical protein
MTMPRHGMLMGCARDGIGHGNDARWHPHHGRDGNGMAPARSQEHGIVIAGRTQARVA